MKIPSNQREKEQTVNYVIDCCMASNDERRSLYERRRKYFLYGQNTEQYVKYNRLKSHMKLVASFLFSPDGLIYNIAPPRNADDRTIGQMLALQDDFNEDVHDSGLADTFSEAVLWALNFDTMIGKLGWNDTKGTMFMKLVEPSSFGFWREDDPDFESQQAMNHRFSLDYDEACARMARAGKASLIPQLQMTDQPNETGLGSTMQAIIISAINGTGINETLTGRANVDFQACPTFRARITAPQITFDETWIWDSDANDYRIFHSLAEGKILLTDSAESIDAIKKAGKDIQGKEVKFSSDTNWFLEKQNPFVPITPFPLYNYAWGDAHMEELIPLQDWSEERLTWIEEILQAQVDPERIGHGITGLVEEKFGLDQGAYYADDNPSATMQELRPPMPEDVFREFNEIGSLMMEASMLTEVTAGKGSGGARGGQQQKQMQITGGGGIRKVAIGLEAALVRMGDIALRLKMKNDDSEIKMPDGSDFIAAQVEEGFSLHVDGHSHSPLFTLENRELAQMYFKAQAIDREWLLRMTNPTQLQNLLHSLKAREKAEAQAKQQQQQMEAMKHEHKGKK